MAAGQGVLTAYFFSIWMFMSLKFHIKENWRIKSYYLALFLKQALGICLKPLCLLFVCIFLWIIQLILHIDRLISNGIIYLTYLIIFSKLKAERSHYPKFVVILDLGRITIAPSPLRIIIYEVKDSFWSKSTI